MIELNYQTWFKVDRRHVVSRYTNTSWVNSGHTPHILVTLWWWRWWVYTCDVVSGESDAGIGGGEHSHHTGVGIGHSDCVAQLYPIRSHWRRPTEHQYTIWYWLWWQIPWLWGQTCMRQKDRLQCRQTNNVFRLQDRLRKIIFRERLLSAKIAARMRILFILLA